MIYIINVVVGCIISGLIILSITSCIATSKKYKKMFETMKSLGQDKHLLMIEREYRHEYLADRVNRIKIFVEREFYQIKLLKIPFYIVEDFSITGLYFTVMLGLTFTLINIGLTNQVISGQVMEIFFLGIIALVGGMIIIFFRNLYGIPETREIFKINLCSYLEYELELFDEAMNDEKVDTPMEKTSKVNKASKGDENSDAVASEHHHNRVSHVSNDRVLCKERLEAYYKEENIVNVLEELFN